MATTVQSTANSEGNVDEKKSEGISDKVIQESEEANKKCDKQDKMATTVRDQSTANSEGIVDGKKSEGISDKVIQESDVANKKCDIPDKMATTGCDQSTADGNGKGDEKKSEDIPDKVSQNLDKANKKPEKPDKMTNTGSDQSTVNSKGKDDGKKSDDISDKVLKELDEAYKKQGIPGITDRVKANLDDWKSVPLNIAVIGNSGVGKSSYINALLGLSADDKGAAPVGVVETTVTLTPFSHPENKNLTLWDLPGVGTPNFAKDGYLQKINFKKYDFFLVLTATRFTENDIWLAQKIRDLGKKFYLIRTKIDMDISNDKKAHPNTHTTRDNVIQKVRSDCMNQLENQNFTNPRVFIISNFVVTEFDFGKLSECLIRDAPDLKREALTLSLSVLTEEIIRAKEKYLKKRIYIVSIASAAAAAVPIPGVGFTVDISTLLEEALFYRKQLRLDDASVEENAAALNISVTELKKRLNLQSQLISYTARGLLAFFGSLGLAKLSENVLKVALPLIGCFIAAGVSYGVQVYCLKQLLNTMVTDALTINAEMNVILASNTF